MKVLLQNRVDMYEKAGGDVILMVEIQKALQKLGIEVTISNELTPDLTGYDIVHLHNVTRIHDTYMQFCNAKAQNKKIVLSPIYHALKEIEEFRSCGQYGILSNIYKVIPNFYVEETLKNSIRFIKDIRQRKSLLLQLQKGFKNQQIEVLKNADIWILSANGEGEMITKELGVTNKAVIAHNGVMIEESSNKISDEVLQKLPQGKFVLCVGRIEPRKNQINLIKALEEYKIPLVFIGDINPNYNRLYNNKYKKEFFSLVEKHDWVFWIGKVDHDFLGQLYEIAHVHVNPSWFEVVSLVNLEAGAYGCNLVLSDVGFQKEYYDKYAFYCDPGDMDSISKAVMKGFNSDKSVMLKEKIQKEYTWENSAKQIVQAYKIIAA